MANENVGAMKGKIAIITGGNRGIGRNTVINLAKRGVYSIFSYNSNSAEADKVAKAIREAGAKAIALQLSAGNVGTFDAFVQSVREALEKLGVKRFDYLVNNAGTSHHNAFDQTTGRSRDHDYS